MAITVLPRNVNPWVAQLPQFVQQLAFQKIGQKFQESQADKRQKIYEQENETQRETDRKRQEEVDAWKKNTTPGVQEVSNISGIPENTSGFFMNQGKLYAKTSPAAAAPKAPKTLNTTDGILQWDETKRTWVNTGRRAPDKGMKLQVGKDGSVTLTQGSVGGVGDLTPANKTNVQKDLMGNIDHLAKIDNIMDTFQPKFHETSTRIGMAWTALKEKTGIGKQPSQGDLKALSEYTTYMKSAHTEMVKTIHDWAGSNMTKTELKKIDNALPNPGAGFIDQDSATQYMSSMSSVRKELTKTAARNAFYLNRQGYTPEQLKSKLGTEDIMSVNSFMEMVDEKALAYRDRLMADAQKQGQQVDLNTIKEQVKQFLNKEFGLKFRN